MTALLACLVLLAGAQATVMPAAAPDSASEAVLRFHYERPGMPVPVYTLTLHESGAGTYRANYVAAAPEPSRYGPSTVTVSPLPTTENTVTMTVSQETTARLFAAARAANLFRTACESKARGIADSGAKTLTYKGPDGTGECRYNFSESKPVNMLYDTLSAIAFTLDMGRTLDARHRFDRLGLDQQMGLLLDALKDNRAAELGTIAPTLASIADDPQVMERVRKRATGLLQMGTSREQNRQQK